MPILVLQRCTCCHSRLHTYFSPTAGSSTLHLFPLETLLQQSYALAELPPTLTRHATLLSYTDQPPEDDIASKASFTELTCTSYREITRALLSPWYCSE